MCAWTENHEFDASLVKDVSQLAAVNSQQSVVAHDNSLVDQIFVESFQYGLIVISFGLLIVFLFFGRSDSSAVGFRFGVKACDCDAIMASKAVYIVKRGFYRRVQTRTTKFGATWL